MQDLNPDAEVEFEHGTVSYVIDFTAGVLRIFSDREPHPDDWHDAQQLALAVTGLGAGWEVFDQAGVDVFDVQIRGCPQSEVA